MGLFRSIPLSIFAGIFWFAGVVHAAEPLSVLVLEQEDPGRPAYVALMSGIRSQLAARIPGRINIFSENLDLARFEGERYHAELEAWLQTKYSGRKLDAVVVVGIRSLELVLKLRPSLWPTVPVVFTAIPSADGARFSSEQGVTGVTTDIDVTGTLAAAVRIAPETKRIAFVSDGRTYSEWHRSALAQAEQFAAGKYELIPLIGLTMAETKQQLAALPRDTVVFYLQINVDGGGQFYIPRDALAELNGASSAPIFGVFETYLGSGLAGGTCIRFVELGREIADQTIAIIHAGASASVPIVPSGAHQLMFDWRELNRRGLGAASFPEGSDVRFRPPTLWESQRGTVIAVALALLVQSGLILALFAQLRRRRRAERSLLQSEERLNLAAESASVGFWSLDKDSGQFWSPPATLELFGVDPGGTWNLTTFLDLVHPDDRGNMRRTIEQALGTPETHRLEYRIARPDGTHRWFVSLGRSRMDSKGGVTGLTGVSIDITNRKLAEDALRREQTLTHAVFDSVPGLLYLYAQDGSMVRWNKKHEDLTGYAAGEISRMRLDDWFDEQDLAPVRAEWERVFTEGHTITEIMLRRKDGTKAPFLATGVRLDIEHKPHLVGIAIDITERKRLEEDAKRHFQELAHISRVATMGELTASLAHELNQPLGAILRNAEAAEILLRSEQPDLDELRAIVADICKDDQRAAHVIERLRGLLKRRDIQPAEIDLGTLIAETATLVKSDAAARSACVEVAAAPGRPRVLGDRIHLQQVLLNLLLNGLDALDSSQEADRRIIVASRLNGDGMVEVSVRDFGGGIAPDDMARLFDSFFTSKTSGLGMGLSISRTIIDAHGGRIWAENNADRGATFRFTLPVAAGSKEG